MQVGREPRSRQSVLPAPPRPVGASPHLPTQDPPRSFSPSDSAARAVGQHGCRAKLLHPTAPAADFVPLHMRGAGMSTPSTRHRLCHLLPVPSPHWCHLPTSALPSPGTAAGAEPVGTKEEGWAGVSPFTGTAGLRCPPADPQPGLTLSAATILAGGPEWSQDAHPLATHLWDTRGCASLSSRIVPSPPTCCARVCLESPAECTLCSLLFINI